MTGGIALCKECLQPILFGDTYQSTDDGTGRRYRHKYHQWWQYLPGETDLDW